MKILSHFSLRQHQHAHRHNHHLRQGFQLEAGRMIMVLFLVFLSTTTTLVNALPTRNFNSISNKLTGAASSAAGSQVIPEEELELESLKGKSSASSPKNLKNQELGVAAAKKSSSPESTTAKPIVYVKKPENEETPALSDNANSLKYGGANAELEEALANMAHIPPSKSPSLSVKQERGQETGGNSVPLGDSILQLQQKRNRQILGTGSGSGLLAKTGGMNLEVDYTPQDIAEYIFWMGDERSVELAINDFIQEGLITPQDAIRFLEDVKAELNSLRNRYASTISNGNMRGSSGLGAGVGTSFPGTGTDSSLGFWEYPARSLTKKQSSPPSSSFLNGNFLGSSSSYPSSYSSMEQMNSYYNTYGRTGTGVGSGLSASSSLPGKYNYWKDSSSLNGNSMEDILDYEEIAEKLRQTDSKMREIALEGIIYQIARELFSMGLQNSPGTSVPTFTTFIENLAVNGNISKDLERSVLETLVQALVDAANERGLLIAKSNEGQDGNGNKQSAFTKSTGAAAALSGLGTSQTKPIIVKKKSA